MADIFEYLNSLKKPWKFLAPMVANSEEAYRHLARKYGADLCYTEMVHCKGFNRGKKNPVSNFWYTTSKNDRPLVIQICGNDVKEMLETCLAVQDYCDAIDINFGCPQDIARRGRYGSYLQDDWPLIENIVKTLSTSIKVPLFCKIRIFESVEKSVEYAKIFEKNGCALLTVHGRTREQKGHKTGLASWEHIKAIKQSLSIPVIANGNMIYHENIQECYEFTGCDGVMVAEPHLYDPTIFVAETYKSIDIFEEYLNIIKDNPSTAHKNNIKSHAFKMLRVFLSEYPSYNSVLNDCKNVNDYLKFIEEIRKLVTEGKISEAYLIFQPYIRKEKEKENNSNNIQ